ncbi:MAG: hypothetical protein JW795_10930 [Chitinivibrionales bacterium]|nr:hypothetical protein [Chitinivibrionales bacterium]
MDKKLIGIATSVAKEKRYDTLDALEFAVHHRFPILQVYLDFELMSNPALMEKVRHRADSQKVRLTCHSPESLSKALINKEIFTAARYLLHHQEQKQLIVHYDERVSIQESFAVIKRLHEEGFSVCLENFYQEQTEQALIRNLNCYNGLQFLTADHHIPFYPVFDLPRLYIAAIFKHYDSLLLVKQMIDTASVCEHQIILHLIDFASYTQERQNWCTFGSGLMPYEEIIAYCRRQQCRCNHAVMEYEDKTMTLQSVAAVHRLLCQDSATTAKADSE